MSLNKTLLLLCCEIQDVYHEAYTSSFLKLTTKKLSNLNGDDNSNVVCTSQKGVLPFWILETLRKCCCAIFRLETASKQSNRKQVEPMLLHEMLLLRISTNLFHSLFSRFFIPAASYYSMVTEEARCFSSPSQHPLSIFPLKHFMCLCTPRFPKNKGIFPPVLTFCLQKQQYMQP